MSNPYNRSSKAYTSDGKRRSSMKHADRVHTCVCGKECRGNGGWSSHKRACALWQEAVTASRAKYEAALIAEGRADLVADLAAFRR